MSTTLFDNAPGLARNDHPDTSSEAAEAITPKTGTLRRIVFDALLRSPDGLTDLELQDVLGMDPSTQRPRRVELVRAELVRDSGRRRIVPSGRLAIVWEVCDALHSEG